MHEFLDNWSRNFIGHALLLLVVALVSFAAVVLFTGNDSKTRKWLLAKDRRMEYLGFGILALVWLGFFIYNRATGT